MEGKSDIQSILAFGASTKKKYAIDATSWEAFVLKLFECNSCYKKTSDLPSDGACLIIVPDQRRSDQTTVNKLMNCSKIISNLNETSPMYFHEEYATLATTSQLIQALRCSPMMLLKFRKFYLFRYNLADLIRFFDLNLFKRFDNLHLVDFKMNRNWSLFV